MVTGAAVGAESLVKDRADRSRRVHELGLSAAVYLRHAATGAHDGSAEVVVE
jgi:hypothetical protein